MINFIDPFERLTIVEILPSFHNDRISFVVRKERQSYYESWDLEAAKKIAMELTQIIQKVQENQECKRNTTL